MRSTLAAALVAAALALPARVSARPRPRFEPTDLEWEDTGVFEVDLEFGAIRSPGPWRFMIPDFELDFGILPNVELDLDGAYAIEGPAAGSFSFDHGVPYSLWPSVKLGLYNDHDDQTNRARAVGIQVGPRIPVASGAHGLGFESLIIFGGSKRGLNVAVNLGAFVEPPPDAVSQYTLGVESGIDLDLVLDSRDRFHLTGEVAAAYFLTAIPASCTRPAASPGRRARTWTFRSSASSAFWRVTIATASFSASSRSCACSRRRRVIVVW